jgi:hypothetical protein
LKFVFQVFLNVQARADDNIDASRCAKAVKLNLSGALLIPANLDLNPKHERAPRAVIPHYAITVRYPGAAEQPAALRKHPTLSALERDQISNAFDGLLMRHAAGFASESRSSKRALKSFTHYASVSSSATVIAVFVPCSSPSVRNLPSGLLNPHHSGHTVRRGCSGRWTPVLPSPTVRHVPDENVLAQRASSNCCSCASNLANAVSSQPSILTRLASFRD